MKRYQNPGLPSWPALFFDERRQKAIVRDKVGSWRSYAKADWAWVLVLLSSFPITGWCAYQNVLSGTADDWLTAFLGTWAIMFVVALAFARWGVLPIFNLHGYRSKQEIVFTPDRIRAGGRNHPRQHQGSPLSITCMIAPDPKAQEKLQLRRYGPKWTHTYQVARCINLVIQVASGGSMFGTKLVIGPGKAIELAKVLGDEKAGQFSAVCQAALELTAPAGEQRAQAVGVDIDALFG